MLLTRIVPSSLLLFNLDFLRARASGYCVRAREGVGKPFWHDKRPLLARFRFYVPNGYAYWHD